MNLLRHQFAKDIRRLYFPLALWVILLILPLVISSALREGAVVTAGQPLRPLLSVADFAMMVLFWVLTIALAAWVVLEDPPKGSTAFWLTRPVPRATITWEKFCLLGVIIVVPALFRMIMAALAGANPAQVAVVGVSVALFHAPVVLAAAAFAVTAETFGEFVTTAILCLIGAGIVSAIIISVITISRFSKHLSSTVTVQVGANDSRLLVGQISIIVLAGAIVGWRYSRRHARLVLLAVGTATIAAVMIPTYWRWDLFLRRPAPEAAVGDSSLEFHGRLSRRGPEEPTMRQREWVLVAGAEFLPGGEAAIPVELREVKLASGDENSVDYPVSRMIAAPGRSEAYEPRALSAALPGIAILNLPPKRDLTYFIDGRIQNSLNRLDLASPVLTAIATTDVCRFEVSSELGLRKGARFSGGLRQLTVHDIDAGASGVEIGLEEGTVDSYLARAIGSAAKYPPAFRTSVESGPRLAGSVTRDFPPIYCLVNRGRRQAVLANRNFETRTRKTGDYQVRDFGLHFGFLNFSQAIDEGWLKEAVLVRIDLRRVGAFDAPFRAAESGP